MFSKGRFPHNLRASASPAADRIWNMRIDPIRAIALTEDAAQ
jgi:hypothetical protein